MKLSGMRDGAKKSVTVPEIPDGWDLCPHMILGSGAIEEMHNASKSHCSIPSSASIVSPSVQQPYILLFQHGFRRYSSNTVQYDL